MAERPQMAPWLSAYFSWLDQVIKNGKATEINDAFRAGYLAAEAKMNADPLLAATPKLLEALKALLRCPEIADCDPRDKDLDTQIAERAAIAEATGRTEG